MNEMFVLLGGSYRHTLTAVSELGGANEKFYQQRFVFSHCTIINDLFMCNYVSNQAIGKNLVLFESHLIVHIHVCID